VQVLLCGRNLMSPRSVLRLARTLRPLIGVHHRLIGDSRSCVATYYAAKAASDVAVSQAKYLICHLADAHAAHLLARAVGMPGYFHLRGRG